MKEDTEKARSPVKEALKHLNAMAYEQLRKERLFYHVMMKKAMQNKQRAAEKSLKKWARRNALTCITGAVATNIGQPTIKETLTVSQH